jgi:hypothetical protein
MAIRKKIKYYNLNSLGTIKGDYLMCPWCAMGLAWNFDDKLKNLEDKSFNWQYETCPHCNKKLKYFKWRNLIHVRRINKF